MEQTKMRTETHRYSISIFTTLRLDLKLKNNKDYENINTQR